MYYTPKKAYGRNQKISIITKKFHINFTFLKKATDTLHIPFQMIQFTVVSLS